MKRYEWMKLVLTEMVFASGFGLVSVLVMVKCGEVLVEMVRWIIG